MEASGHLHTLTALPWGKSPSIHWVGSRVDLGVVGKRKKSRHCTCWELNPRCPTHSLVYIYMRVYHEFISYTFISYLSKGSISRNSFHESHLCCLCNYEFHDIQSSFCRQQLCSQSRCTLLLQNWRFIIVITKCLSQFSPVQNLFL